MYVLPYSHNEKLLLSCVHVTDRRMFFIPACFPFLAGRDTT